MANSAFDHTAAITLPGSSTNTGIVTWSGTGANTLLDSTVLVSGNNITIPGTITLGGTAITSTAAEINLLDALDRGSILYGNASGATAVLGQGSNGQVLTSDGTDISWAAASGTTINNNADNRVITGSGTANTLEGEATLTFGSNALSFDNDHDGNNAINLLNDSNTASASTRLTIQCAGASAGDAVALFHAGGDSYIIGVDNSDSNKFKIAATGGNLGTNDRFIMNTTGVEAIKFSPTQVASADVNTLDDYEEGTFTPTILDNDLNASESQTYLANNNFGTYVKIGRAVFYSLYMRVTSFGNLTTSHHAKIGGLPFATSNNGMARYASVMLDNGALATAGFSVVAELPPNVSYAMLRTWDVTNGTTYTTLNELSSDAALRFTGHYEI